MDTVTLQELLPCDQLEFPCKYLGLPLSLKKLTKAQLQPYIDRLAARLPGWKAELLTKEGRKVLVQHVLTPMLIYLVMAIDLPPWAIKAFDKIRRGFLWRGRKDANGGQCLVAWPKVCLPTEFGGLGISNLQNLNWALRMRWLWLKKTDPNLPWASFNLSVHKCAQAFFSIAVVSEVGNGAATFFWSDRWIHGQRIADLAPQVLATVSKRRINQRKVQEALTDNAWARDIQGALTVGVINEYLALWNLISEVVLQPEVDDVHIWRFSSDGKYSTKSAYDNQFHGAVAFKSRERIWKTWAPGKCRFFM